ncbi:MULTISPECIES: alpha-L-rhamnosidase [Acidobacteriaceae]|uniref:MGH1-like glycoside hydrolase domain-containing protein n=1 Tax=Acidobacteriaceae TaxID=204434 RepID=UPI00131EC700|nr:MULTISPECIES: alpha-L-rhamnosidase [Acidobacteriaceae]MDW5265778.1 alpha-L-rhamnosidase [Edaphobacter sp.]
MPQPKPPLQRRDFLKLTALATGASIVSPFALAEAAKPAASSAPPAFPTSDPRWQRTWDAAIAALAGNIHTLPRYPRPVLVEGSVYPGIWQECAPQEGLVYGTLSQYITPASKDEEPLKVARNNHMAFFALQRSDGQLPSSVKLSDPIENAGGYGQIQMVVPIAATAWELSQLTGDDELLVSAYIACSRWDAWLREYRDTRKTGLVEGFCTYDTGHDNSPRWKGIPNRCPDADARKYPDLPTMPRLCPDLSATVYGARIALAQMATALAKHNEADRWLADAEAIRRLIIDKLYDPKDAAFYDLDAQNNFVRVRSDVISRVLGEHVLKPSDPKDAAIFDAVWTRQIHNPKAFWAPYPLTSIAMDDPSFVRPIPRNSWGGATQALTALRAPRWMSFYGKQAELNHLMMQWCEAISRHTEFRQQMDPLSGDFTQADPSGYSPAALVYLDFIHRLGKSAV